MKEKKTKYEFLKSAANDRYVAAVVALWDSRRRNEWITNIDFRRLLVEFGMTQGSAKELFIKPERLDKAINKNLLLRKNTEGQYMYKLTEKGAKFAEDIYEVVRLISNLPQQRDA